MLPGLLNQAVALGFEIRPGDLFRDPRLHGPPGSPDLFTWLLVKYPDIAAQAKADGYNGYGHKKSAHKNKIAIDLNLRYRNGNMAESTEDHRALGEWWEKQHELCRWGGRFADGNHYSLWHEGMM